MPIKKETWFCCSCMTEYPTEQQASKCETQLRAKRIYNHGDVLTVKSWKHGETYELVEVKVVYYTVGPASSGAKGLHENYVKIDKKIYILGGYNYDKNSWNLELTDLIPASKIDD